MYVQFAPEDIRHVTFETTHDGSDDGDALYEGVLIIIMMSGHEHKYECTWVREGDRDDFFNEDKQAVVEYLNEHEPEEL